VFGHFVFNQVVTIYVHKNAQLNLHACASVTLKLFFPVVCLEHIPIHVIYVYQIRFTRSLQDFSGMSSILFHCQLA
jgi:hypothetical protein